MPIARFILSETMPHAEQIMLTEDQNFPPPPIPATNDPRWYIKKPLGFSYFPMELAPVPRSWVETTGNLVFWGQHQRVGP